MNHNLHFTISIVSVTVYPYGMAEENISTINDGAASLSSGLYGWLENQDWLPSAAVPIVTQFILLVMLIAFAALLYLVIRPLILRWVKSIVKATDSDLDNELVGHGVFRWITHLVPALMIHAVAPGLFEDASTMAKIITGIARVYLILTGFFLVDSILNAGHALYRRTDVSKRIPVGTFVQVAKLLAALVAVILVIAVVAGKSPAALLGGLGAFAAVLMLVFKDTILGFVAGIQLASNRMLAVGDWLEMPSQNADGDVEEIGLTTVKVRNWDKTISTIPTYALITQSFKNWRGMQESGGRRIKRSLLIDVDSIRLCDESMLARFRDIEHIEEYLKCKEEEVAAWNAENGLTGDENRVNGRRLTNVGTFRAYIESYLRHHPELNQEMTLLVRQLEPTPEGLPIQIYCFSANKVWAEYERIQSDIFDHLLAVAREFDLHIYQQPSGMDVRESTLVMKSS